MYTSYTLFTMYTKNVIIDTDIKQKRTLKTNKNRSEKMIITVGNYKGGVGKTTTAQLFAYLLSEQYNKKVLVIDTDPQANLTETLALTFKKELDPEKNLFNAIFSNDEAKTKIQTLSDNLDILAGSWNMINFEAEVRKTFYADKISYVLKNVVSEIEDNYDFILIDTAPTTNLVMENILFFTDYVLITTQTVPLAYDSTLKFYDYLLDFYMSDETHFSLLGVLPYLVSKSVTDEKILEQYKIDFEDELFKAQVRSSDRVKTWSRNGITTNQSYDKITLAMYDEVVKEALERLERKIEDEKEKNV